MLDKTAKILYNNREQFKDQYAAVVESADTKDLKSFGSDTVPVQVRSAAPSKPNGLDIMLTKGSTMPFVSNFYVDSKIPVP